MFQVAKGDQSLQVGTAPPPKTAAHSAHPVEHFARALLVLMLLGLAIKNLVVGHFPLAAIVAVFDVLLVLNLISDCRRTARFVSSRVLSVVLALMLMISAATLGVGGAIWAFPALVGARILGSRGASVAMALILSTAIPVILAYEGDAANAARMFGALLLTSFYVIFAQGHVPAFGEALDQTSMRDPLTRVFNRARLDRAVADLKPNEFAGLVFVEVKHFSEMNQEFGRGAGDDILRRVAATVQGFLGEHEHVYRVGPAEFVVFMRGWSSVETLALTDRIRDHFKTEKPLGETNLALTASSLTGGQNAANALEDMRAKLLNVRAMA